MTTVTVTLPAGPDLVWTDGALVPPDWAEQLDWLAGRTARVQLRPDSASLPAAAWRSDPWAFIACCLELEPGASVSSSIGMPPAPEGPPADRPPL